MDSPTTAARRAWIENLDALMARNPSVVVPGHTDDDSVTDASTITYTREYLVAFDEELTKASNSAALVRAMQERYPKAGMGVALDIGAKVAKGEMKWG